MYREKLLVNHLRKLDGQTQTFDAFYNVKCMSSRSHKAVKRCL